jgi:hypothetical protein
VIQMAGFRLHLALLIATFCAFGAACSTILGIGDPIVSADGGPSASQDGTIAAGDATAGIGDAAAIPTWTCPPGSAGFTDCGTSSLSCCASLDAGAPNHQTAGDGDLVANAMTGTLDGGRPADEGSGDAGGGCTTTATQALIDNMTAQMGVGIALPNPACSWPGGWFDWANTGGVIGNPPESPTNPAPPMAFSPLPTAVPAEAGISGGTSKPRAACIVGATGTGPDVTAGMGIYFGITQESDGGNGPLVQVNASSYAGIQFWAWGASDAGAQSIAVHILDKSETKGLGVCDPTENTGNTACGAAAKSITIGPGWQFVQVPFALFANNPDYGGGNETMLDPSSLTEINWSVALGSDGGAALPFDFCLYNVAFYSGTVDFSCAVGGAGLNNCGEIGESCCTSPEVRGGTFDRYYDDINWQDGGIVLAIDGGATDESASATVSGFRLDKYLVTVGRFRQYVDYLTSSAGSPPANGSGIHTHLNGGRGLANNGSPASYEPGWDATDWNMYIATGAAREERVGQHPVLRPKLRNVDEHAGHSREPAHQLCKLVRGIRVLHLGWRISAERGRVGVCGRGREPAARIPVGLDGSGDEHPIRDLQLRLSERIKAVHGDSEHRAGRNCHAGGWALGTARSGRRGEGMAPRLVCGIPSLHGLCRHHGSFRPCGAGWHLVLLLRRSGGRQASEQHVALASPDPLPSSSPAAPR